MDNIARVYKEQNAIDIALGYANHPTPKSWKDYIARLSGALDYGLAKIESKF